ncbi:hypothetical protein [Methylobacterium brachythecii]|uniref:Flagellar export protein FliJ n=1 Tax=Methylobacterium brachythecii TaxID=1176177 RepID=A0A7W6ALB3_9HYPH|nr:hypothetical protein [Methylobacterium brachythecii]MBB3903299.1 hypothetical protein [Methylobacterium brachythecii]GLS46083.1 hypothetical protein GCM10007884_40740 [Methylobacterium brachythecii]
MDDAAVRVSPADLARLARLRERREEAARRRLRALAVAREVAEAERASAARAFAASEATRVERERAIYDGLSAGGPVALATLMESRVAVADLGTAVERAKETEAERADEAEQAGSAHETGRRDHADRSRDVRRWDRAGTRILSARAARGDIVDEIETEDEILMRMSRGGAVS